jgi:hypothetical protein
MPLKFISHREVSFRNLLGMLRTPPQAMMTYYSNLFMSAKFVFGDNPETIHYIDKEIRRIECMVGYYKTLESLELMAKINSLSAEKYVLERQKSLLEARWGITPEEEQSKLMEDFEKVEKKLNELNNQEFFLYSQIEPLMNLKQIETYMDNNMDLKSYFKEGGQKVYQMQLLGELDRLKIWIYQQATEMMPYIRFTKME